MRAVIDTNLLVAAMISRPGSTPRKLLEAVRDGRLKLVVSQPLIDEFLDVMSRPKLARYGITIGIVLDFLESLLAVASLVAITGAPKGCDDPDDDAVIETAEVGAADYLITGDSDLLEERIRASLVRIGIEVITARDFLRGSLAAQLSSTTIVDHARMLVASEVASAITSSAWQQAQLTAVTGAPKEPPVSADVTVALRGYEAKTGAGVIGVRRTLVVRRINRQGI
jgi:putative PIN family toxin of toxin-antitoxin system